MSDDGVAWVALPPYGVPMGPLTDDQGVLSAFAGGDRHAGHSEHFHVEGEALMVDGDIPIALRLGSGAVLARTDLPEGLEGFVAPVAEALSSAGLTRLDEESLLAGPVAMQVLGLRLSSWDLWGDDIDAAFEALRTAAVGEQSLPHDTAGTWDW